MKLITVTNKKCNEQQWTTQMATVDRTGPYRSTVPVHSGQQPWSTVATALCNCSLNVTIPEHLDRLNL